MPPFRLNAKAFFLTYPQCPITPDVLGAHLESLGTTSYTLVAQELHESGEWHLHALVIFIDKKNIRRQDYFDFEHHHPNIQAPRDRSAIKKYILKGDPVDEAKYESGAFDDGARGGSTRAAWMAAIEAPTAEATMEAVKQASPRDFLLSHDRVEQFAQTKRRQHVTYVPNADDIFILPEAISNWVLTDYLSRVSSGSSLRS